MRTFFRLASIASLSAGLAGCLSPMGDDPYPVLDNSPNPAPVPGYRVRCQSEPGPFSFLDESFITACQQYIAPTRRVTVIRAKG